MNLQDRLQRYTVLFWGIIIFLLAINVGLWWGEGYLSDYVAALPRQHLFLDDYEPHILLRMKENVLSGAHRAAQGIVAEMLKNILGKKREDQSLEQFLSGLVQPSTHYLGIVRAGDYCLITSETADEIWCQRVIRVGERDGVPYWGWPPNQEGLVERPYLFPRVYPQLFLGGVSQLQGKDIEELVERLNVYWLKPSPYAQIEQHEGYLYSGMVKGTLSMTRQENAVLWAGRMQVYHRVQVLLGIVFLFIAPTFLTVLYGDRMKLLAKRMVEQIRQRSAASGLSQKRQREQQELHQEGVGAYQRGGFMGLIDPDQIYSTKQTPARTGNPLMGALLSLGFRWQTYTEMKDIERLIALISTKIDLAEVSKQQVEAEKQLVMKLADAGGITPRLIERFEQLGYYRLVELLKQKQELQDLEHREQVVTKQLAIREKERQLEELSKPKKPVNRQDWEEHIIRKLRREIALKIRLGVARAEAVETERRAMKDYVDRKFPGESETKKRIYDFIDWMCDYFLQLPGAEYEDGDDIL